MFSKDQQTTKQPKKKELPLTQLKKRVQKKVNTYVRLRDASEPCISCQKPIIGSGQAGHYINQGSSGFLRYNLSNIHRQCIACNLFKSGNLIEYRMHLVEKIGEEQVKWLEEHRHDLHKYTREELLQKEQDIKLLQEDL